MTAPDAGAAAEISIRAEGVARHFGGAAVLDGVDLTVRRGEIVSLIGPSGSGKSTLLRMLAGLDRPDAGRITAFGREVVRPDRSIGFMFQEPRLLPWLTVRDNIVLGLPRAERRRADARVAALLAQVQLDGAAGLYPRQLSGGMAQRVALARCLAVEPSVLLLDEPFSAVDALTRMALQELLLAIWQRTHLTMVLVTHDLDEALYLGDRIVAMIGRPAGLGEPISVALPRPRDRRGEVMALHRGTLLDALHVTSAPAHAPGPGHNGASVVSRGGGASYDV